MPQQKCVNQINLVPGVAVETFTEGTPDCCLVAGATTPIYHVCRITNHSTWDYDFSWCARILDPCLTYVGPTISGSDEWECARFLVPGEGSRDTREEIEPFGVSGTIYRDQTIRIEWWSYGYRGRWDKWTFNGCAIQLDVCC